jgi:hypothetical protein
VTRAEADGLRGAGAHARDVGTYLGATCGLYWRRGLSCIGTRSQKQRKRRDGHPRSRAHLRVGRRAPGSLACRLLP